MNIRQLERAFNEARDEFAQIVATKVAELVVSRLEALLLAGGPIHQRPRARRSPKAMSASKRSVGAHQRRVSSVRITKSKAAVAAFRSGQSVPAIAARLKIGVSTVYRYLKASGVSGR